MSIMILNARFLTTLVMFALFVAACVLALGLPTKAAFMPLLVGVPGALLCGAQLILDLRRGPDAPVEADEDDVDTSAQSEAQAFGWLALFAVALVGFGFVAGGPIIVGAFVRFSSKDTWKNAAIAAGGTFVVLWGIFIWLLELSLFKGLIVEALFG
jgi:hypothetical protein